MRSWKMRLAVQLYRIAVLLGPDDRLSVCPLTEHYLARSRVAFLLPEAYALKAPALTGFLHQWSDEPHQLAFNNWH